MLLRIDNEGRVTIPKHLRESFTLSAGDGVEAVETSDGLLLILKPGDGVNPNRRSRHDSLAEEMRKDWGI